MTNMLDSEKCLSPLSVLDFLTQLIMNSNQACLEKKNGAILHVDFDCGCPTPIG